MFLKKLELQGFKSFPDKTVLNFDRGVTAVIGPNGSGKSNISDAMKWVLGEVSSKNLRGGSMEDVIFGGSSTKKPMGFAEVSVTFGQFPQNGGPFDSEDGEMRITRRYYRVGESEYMINQKPCKLRDIHELFLNTGIGREGYSIVGQGKISDIVSQKNESRRNILEEAAGISKYRYKKKEAQRKLLAVEDNLLRVRDISSELEARVGPLENEAQKAKKYLALYEEKKKLDIGLYLYEAESGMRMSKDLEEQLILAKRDYDFSSDRLSELERKNEQTFCAAQENKRDSVELMQQIQNLSENKLSLEGEVRVLENDSAHSLERIKLINEELFERDAELAQRNVALGAQTELLLTAEQECAAIGAECDELEERVLCTRAELVTLGNDVYDSKEELAKAQSELSDARISLSVLESTEKISLASHAELLTQREELCAQKDELSEKRSLLSEQTDEYKNNASEAQTKINERRDEVGDIAAKRGAVQKELAEAKIVLGSQKAKIDQLLRMDELFEGYSRSVKFLMSEFKNGRVFHRDGSACRIYGPVSKLISVPSEYAVAIETALGANVQNIVLQSEQDAKAAIEFLKQNRAGRATFYPVETVKPQNRPAEINNIHNHSGYIAVASELVNTEDRFAGIIDNLLARTVVVDNIDSAAEMAKKTAYRVRFVTLDGQLINAGGSFTGGSLRQDSGMLSRSSEIEKQKAACLETEERIGALGAKLASFDKEIADIEFSIKNDQLKITMLEALISEQNTALSVLDSKLDGIDTALASLNSEEQKRGVDSERYSKDRADLSEKIRILEDRINMLSSRIEEESARAEDIENEIASMRQLQSKKLIALAEKKKDCEAGAAARNMFLAEIEKLSLRIQRDKDEVSCCRDRNADALCSIEQKNAQIAELCIKIEECRALYQKKNSDEMGFDKKLAELREKISAESQQKELFSRNLVKLENEHKSLLDAQDRQGATIWEAYELTYSAAKAAEHTEVCADNKAECTLEQGKLKSKIRSLGHINLSAVEEYEEVRTRYEFLSSQIQDLETSKKDLDGIIRKLEAEMKKRFSEAFEEINKNFMQVFGELFGGGKAELILADPENILECDIEIAVAPPGKIIKSMSLLSGGEQAFCAIALYFAILKLSPTPFCIFDEIEAALDDVNVDRFADYVKRYAEDTQIIVITHRRGTMEMADRLYGVTMASKGISNVFELDAANVSSEYDISK